MFGKSCEVFFDMVMILSILFKVFVIRYFWGGDMIWVEIGVNCCLIIVSEFVFRVVD